MNLCDSCETVSHCTAHGCIPLTECINSGQVSAAQVVAHAESGEVVATSPDDIYAEDKAVDSFAERMKWKLAKSRERGKYGWQDKNWTPDQISQALREHVAKGDPVDVANYCMFLAARNEPITQAVAHAEASELSMSMFASREDYDKAAAQLPIGRVVTYNAGGSGERNEIERFDKPGYSLAHSLPDGALLYSEATIAAERAEVARLREALQNLLGGVGMCLTSRGERIIDCPVGVAARQVLYPDANIKYTAPGEKHE